MKDFGIIIATCRTDVHFAQASYWSIRYFMGPSIPVCFIVDGDPQWLGKTIENDTNVSFVTRATMENAWMREHSFGWGTTKIISFYEAPFKRFLYMDADAMPFGDITKIRDDSMDMIADCGQTYSDKEINFWFFNTEKVEKIWPDFDWRAASDKYFCPGTFWGRRELFALENYQEKMNLATQDPKLFNFGGDMGLFNLMIFHAAQKKEITVKSLDYQVIPVDNSDAVLREKYSPAAAMGKVDEPKVIHFCGRKPHIFTSSPKMTTMNYFRLRFLMEAEGLSLAHAVCRMSCQDFRYVCIPWLKRGLRKLKRVGKKFLKYT